ncbi:sulfotransferase family protein [Aquabacterium sp.]|uniref:sulfotransferase family protein n=1 Tax=Aquabacterium sp. TaxID=1872578 RepID=UPI002BCAE908|nr:sulfotransferase [Aquabacterium sp.]HSW03558.1 sulfotransferase [Aquabacterium sp.]
MLRGTSLPPREQLSARAALYAYPDPAQADAARADAARADADQAEATPAALARPDPAAATQPTLDPQALMALARERTGLQDFGPGPLEEPLLMLCHSLAHEMQLSAAGRHSAHQRLLQLLCTRARLQALWQRHPEILELEVAEPWFIVGLPRSGTTLTHRLLSRDPGLRSAPLWELMHPLPLGEPISAAAAAQAMASGGTPNAPDPRINLAEQALQRLHHVAPELLRMHEMQADEPDEELNLLALGFCSMGFEFSFCVPSYVRWYARQDHTEGYRLFRRVLQTLQWLRGGSRWILKAPSHMEQLRPLLTVFPDATVIQTHRDAAVTTVSLASLTCYGVRAYFDHPNPLVLGSSLSGAVERLLRAFDRDRANGDERFVDIHFGALMREPIEALRQVYAARGRPFSAAAEQAMRDYIAAHPRGRHGAHDYAAEDFGLDLAERRRALAFYHQRFGVAEEAGK